MSDNPSPYRPGMCPFCNRIEAGDYIERRSDVVRFEPLNPVTPGHMLFVPVRHAPAADYDPMGAARAVKVAAEYIRDSGPRDANIITSIGTFATQTVWHTHIHVVPRDLNDGLHLPWTGQADA
ncbi:HIT family protein [Nocardia gipuzkoensis]|uniref:HIT family protein n=1 Tax=Nocardia gipuzkoensis TaxID=2749991 RepID=UPI00237E022C|nr:HIT domain-containing protein [Nocardia gipuzkoensis]MDE1673782.1 HIT domain-containing protein [Nocardia gipuzkoensis]